MPLKIAHARSGFTLVEIMIVVALITLLSSIAVPNYLCARKRAQARRELNDLRMLDAAIDQYAVETNRFSGVNPTFADLKKYLKTDSLLYASGVDVFGTSYGPFTVDSVPKVPTSTFNCLSDVVNAAFWSPFK